MKAMVAEYEAKIAELRNDQKHVWSHIKKVKNR